MKPGDVVDERVDFAVRITACLRKGIAHRLQRGGRRTVRILIRAEAYEGRRVRPRGELQRQRGSRGGTTDELCECATGESGHDRLLWFRTVYARPSPARRARLSTTSPRHRRARTDRRCIWSARRRPSLATR